MRRYTQEVNTVVVAGSENFISAGRNEVKGIERVSPVKHV